MAQRPCRRRCQAPGLQLQPRRTFQWTVIARSHHRVAGTIGDLCESEPRAFSSERTTRNNRLAAIHAFFQYVAISEPALALQCQRVLAIPSKRYERGPVEFLTEEETAALVAAPNPGTWIGRRDKALLLVAVQTGLRNSEITSLRHQDVEFGTGAHVRCLGKGRKMRCTPLRPDVAAVLKEWLSQQGGAAADPVFPSSKGAASAPMHFSGSSHDISQPHAGPVPRCCRRR